jgi:Glycosyl transferases group 1
MSELRQARTMIGAKLVLSRRTLTLAQDPAAWQAIIAQQAWRLSGPCPPVHDPPRVTDPPSVIYWPTEYQHFNAARFVQPLREGLGMLTRVEPRTISQPYEGIVLLNVHHHDRTFPVAIDYYDLPIINTECLDVVALYFKMQHRRSGYDSAKILPGGYVAGKRSLYDYHCRLRALGQSTPQHDVYGRFGTRFSADIRRRAVAILQDQRDFRFTGGTSLALYMQSLREAARARVCIDMPGNGPFCYRLVEYLAIGCCIVGPRHAGIMHADLRDREHIVYCKDDLSDLADLCDHYVQNDEAREAVATNAARFFDEHLHPVQLANYYMRLFSERLAS